MALEMNDLVALKQLENGMSPYEQIKTQNMAAKSHTGGVAIAGLTVASVAAVAGITAWIFGPLYGNAKAAQAKEAAVAAKEQANILAAGTQRQLDQLTNLFAAERNERIQGDFTLNQTITDTVSGQQASNLTAQQAAELSAIQTATNTVTTGLMTGQYSQNPMRVVRVSGTRECPCDGGCGCNG